MKNGRFETLEEWLDACRATVRRDFDNVMLFVGPEGEGKSTFMFQVMRALDPTFTAERAHFGIANFLAAAPGTPRYGAVAADELEASNRRGMSEANVDLLLFLKDCRGLNLHIAMCYPHEELFEAAILNHRVRWKVEIPHRGIAVIYDRAERKTRRKTGEEVSTFLWVERYRTKTYENRSRLWDEYREKKDAHMLNLGGKYREALAAGSLDTEAAAVRFRGVMEKGEWVDPDEAKPQPGMRRELSSGVDGAAAVGRFLRARRKYEERSGPGSAIKDLP